MGVTKRICERKAVWFSMEEQQIFEELGKKRKISQNFQDFAKNAFHEKVDALMNSQSQEIT